MCCILRIRGEITKTGKQQPLVLQRLGFVSFYSFFIPVQPNAAQVTQHYPDTPALFTAQQ